MKKKDKKLYIFGIAGLVVIIIFYLFFFNKRDEYYTCTFADGSGPVYLGIESKNIIYENVHDTKAKITKETKSKIFAGDNDKYVFRKHANILKIRHTADGSVIFTVNCTRLK